MGHPELNNAIAYVCRCRNSIDMELFRLFKPNPQRWAINGTAGMGKSVLLAYAIFVIASNKRVVVENESGDFEKALVDFSREASQLGLPKHRERVIHAVARKEKQLAVLEYYWNRFVQEYSVLESMGLQFQKPIFRKWDAAIDPDCNVLIIDEAHDLDSDDQKAVAEWLNLPGTQRYLAIACDRHQKLRLVGPDAVLIEGLNFSRQTQKLRRNYRNPFPVYAAGLGLMFRWFARNGPKIIPNKTQLEEDFGFEIAEYSDAPRRRIVLKNWNDSHPGNYWSFTVSTFPSCADAFAQLVNAGLTKEKVLWVRFGEEEDAFDYEELLRFTYHNCFTPESFDLVDKYVKGQEFPVVVIEGVPPDAELQNFQSDGDDHEKAMWIARRELYLCCSRSTCFLYFVMPSPTVEKQGRESIWTEIQEMVGQVSRPSNPDAVTKRMWQLQFERTGLSRKVDEFIYDSAQVKEDTRELGKIELEAPITIQKLAQALRVQPAKLVEDLFGLNFTFKSSRDVVPEEIAREVSLRHGSTLTIGEVRQITLQPQGDVSWQPRFKPTREDQEGEFAEPRVVSQPTSSSEKQERPELAGDLDLKLREFLSSPRFPQFKRAVDQYLAILAWVAESHPRGRECILSFRRGHRRYFATSLEEIEQRAASPNVKAIGATGLYALTTTDTQTKRSIVAAVLNCCGFGLDAREKAAQAIMR